MIQTLADALAQKGYDTLTPVQEAVTAPDLATADLLVSAQTGSGKTVGFGLAIAPTILGTDERFGPAAAPLALVIAPTRELALQVKREFQWLFAGAGAVVASCVGGMDMRDERRTLDRGAHIVVATPGRLRDHIMRQSLDMSSLRAVVLDEADEMLDLGFREDLEFILGEAPEGRRTLMFSATVPKAIATLAQSYQKDARRIATAAEKSQHSDISYRALSVAQPDAENAIINVLRFYEAPNALVFCNTRAMVNRLTTRLSNRGFQVVALSGELTQTERTHALQAMRDGRARVCVATDVAARGIDLPNLELVVHGELPSNSETLLHRSGRTGRAGRKGVSVLIVPPKVRKKAERLLSGAKVRADWGVPPSADEVREQDEERMLRDPVWDEEISETDSETADRLLALHDARKVAAAYVRLFTSRQGAPEDLSDPTAPPPPRPAFGPSVWFSVGVGRAQNAEPRWLLPMLCKSGNITKDDIGAIRIQTHESFVELRAPSVAGFLAAIGPAMTLEGGTTLKQLPGAPDVARGPRPDRKPDRKPDLKADDRPARPAPRPRAPAAEKPRWSPVASEARHSERPDEATRPVAPQAQAPAPRKPRPQWDAPAKPRTAPATSETPATPPRKPYSAKPYTAKPKGDAAKAPGKTQGKPPFKSAGKPKPKPRAATEDAPAKRIASKPPAKPAGDARDPSKRFTPPGARPAGPRSGKPKTSKGAKSGKGPDATPRRKPKAPR